MIKNLKKHHIRVTPLDIRVMKEIDEQGFKTYQELRQSSLQSCSRVWSWKILKRLSRAGLITEIRDGSGSIRGWKSSNFVKLRGLEVYSNSKISRGKAPQYSNTFHHDQEVRLSLDQLKNLQGVTEINTESKLKEDAFAGNGRVSLREMKRLTALIPDADFKLMVNGTKFKAAFEMELNRKSNKRVEAKIEHYLAHSEYDLILYVCANDSIQRHLWRFYQHVLRTSPAVKFSKKKRLIYFASLQEFKADFKKAIFKGLNDEFTFEEFA